MRRAYRFLKACFIFARHQAWAEAPKWQAGDAIALTSFLTSPTGARFRALLANTVVLQQAHALNRKDGLVYEAGYCAGQKGLVALIEAHANQDNFTEQGDTDADPATSQEAS